MTDEFTMFVFSPSDRENLVVEISYGENTIAEISREPGQDFVVELYGKTDGGYHVFDYSDFIEILEKAKERLEGMYRDT